MIKKTTKTTLVFMATMSLTLLAGSGAYAYPVNNDTQIVLSKTSAIRAGSVIKVKAQNIDRNCEVTFTIAGRGTDNEDYDIASAFSGPNYQTAYTALSVPETPGTYEVQADYEPACQASGNHARKNRSLFQVGKITSLTIPTFSAANNQTLLAKKPTLNFNGQLLVRSTLGGSPTGFGGQKVSVVVTVNPGNVSLPAVIVTTAADGTYSGKQALTPKNLKGSYTVKASFIGDKTYSSSNSDVSSSISITSLKLKIAAAKAAVSLEALRRASITKLTR